MAGDKRRSRYNRGMEPQQQDLLWRIYHRPVPPEAWTDDGNLPWNDVDFSIRMLREHLDEAHGAASRVSAERALQLDWLWDALRLQRDQTVADITCGPGLYAVELARRGCRVTGIDFAPAALAYAEEAAREQGVTARCTFIEADVRQMSLPPASCDAALILYGQLAVMRPQEAAALLAATARALRPGGRLLIELLNPEGVDRGKSSWWYTDDRGLWGNAPFLHLGERYWDEDQECSIERYQIIHLESGKMDLIHLCDQVYRPERITRMLHEAGFASVTVHPGWDGLPLYDADEWIVYVATRGPREDAQ